MMGPMVHVMILEMILAGASTFGSGATLCVLLAPKLAATRQSRNFVLVHDRIPGQLAKKGL